MSAYFTKTDSKQYLTATRSLLTRLHVENPKDSPSVLAHVLVKRDFLETFDSGFLAIDRKVISRFVALLAIAG